MKAILDTNELFKIEHDEYGTFYFDTLHRAGEFLGCGRGPMEYWLNRKGNGYKGWKVSIVDGTDIPWGFINCDREKLLERMNEPF